MSSGFVEVDVWPSQETRSIRREITRLQFLAAASLILKGTLLISSSSLLTVSVLYQTTHPITFQSLGGLLSATIITPITLLSLVSDCVHFRGKFIKYKSIIVLLAAPFWILGSVIVVCELGLSVFWLINISMDSGVTAYFLSVNHIFEAPLILASVVVSLIAWNLISKSQSDERATDVAWNVDDIITYTPRY
ncbi:hypothetical protein LOD99_5945 [Oopsacas minuta]|uniref:Uncharacterized protein n=1 Tax=Oopsacas minuta TaxID=111878 RepID=A0AAV7JMY3_9METZ|nr:hypothetical protein LOD99_5945 [Oopsacas minuta]